ncbi:MAG: hypothetical protein BWY98_01236 [Tenericutes bacterium ADurb.BinA155]|nr:MAG: hypothetical protein BWY98_01236 [Tenericutes bacterium ADurb.BinA155]
MKSETTRTFSLSVEVKKFTRAAQLKTKLPESVVSVNA